MRGRFIVLAVVLSAVDAHTTFGGPLSESVSREAAKIGVASAGQAHASKRMVWTGVAVAGRQAVARPRSATRRARVCLGR
jgi:hypothetical protein